MKQSGNLIQVELINYDIVRFFYVFKYLFWYLGKYAICNYKVWKDCFQKKLSSENVTKGTHRSALVAFAKCTFVYCIFVFVVVSGCYIYWRNFILLLKIFFDIYIYLKCMFIFSNLFFLMYNNKSHIFF